MIKTLFVACRSRGPGLPEWGPAGRVDRVANHYRFCYTRGAKSLSGFRPFDEMPDLEQVYESAALFPLFANRLLSPSRPEYDAFLRWGDFAPETAPDPIAILSVTEGIRQTDGIEVFPCPLPGDKDYFNKFFLHGIRWLPPEAVARINRLRPGEQLVVKPEPENSYDPCAVSVHTTIDDVMVGYVPRYLARDACKLLENCDPECIEVTVTRVNPDAPLQHRLLCRMSACWPDGFRPCSGSAFLPIPANVPSPCEA